MTIIRGVVSKKFTIFEFFLRCLGDFSILFMQSFLLARFQSVLDTYNKINILSINVLVILGAMFKVSIVAHGHFRQRTGAPVQLDEAFILVNFIDLYLPRYP